MLKAFLYIFYYYCNEHYLFLVSNTEFRIGMILKNLLKELCIADICRTYPGVVISKYFRQRKLAPTT